MELVSLNPLESPTDPDATNFADSRLLVRPNGAVSASFGDENIEEARNGLELVIGSVTLNAPDERMLSDSENSCEWSKVGRELALRPGVAVILAVERRARVGAKGSDWVNVKVGTGEGVAIGLCV
jgi:hypothetical protein